MPCPSAVILYSWITEPVKCLATTNVHCSSPCKHWRMLWNKQNLNISDTRKFDKIQFKKYPITFNEMNKYVILYPIPITLFLKAHLNMLGQCLPLLLATVHDMYTMRLMTSPRARFSEIFPWGQLCNIWTGGKFATSRPRGRFPGFFMLKNMRGVYFLIHISFLLC